MKIRKFNNHQGSKRVSFLMTEPARKISELPRPSLRLEMKTQFRHIFLCKSLSQLRLAYFIHYPGQICTVGNSRIQCIFRSIPVKWPEIIGNCAENGSSAFPTETHQNFPVIFPPDPAGNEMESCRQKSDHFQAGNVSPEKVEYDRFRKEN